VGFYAGTKRHPSDTGATLKQLQEAEQKVNRLEAVVATQRGREQSFDAELAAARERETATRAREKTVAALQQRVDVLSKELGAERARTKKGVLIWKDTLEPRSFGREDTIEVVVTAGTPLRGSWIAGEFPRGPYTISACDPKDEKVQLREPPRASDWTRFTFRVQGKGETKAVLCWVLR
jgi:hypothetical protein